MSTSKVRLCQEITDPDDKDIFDLMPGTNLGADPANGILSCREVLYKDLDHETLELMYEFSIANGNLNHDFLFKIRPEWCKKFHPEMVH